MKRNGGAGGGRLFVRGVAGGGWGRGRCVWEERRERVGEVAVLGSRY